MTQGEAGLAQWGRASRFPPVIQHRCPGVSDTDQEATSVFLSKNHADTTCWMEEDQSSGLQAELDWQTLHLPLSHLFIKEVSGIPSKPPAHPCTLILSVWKYNSIQKFAQGTKDWGRGPGMGRTRRSKATLRMTWIWDMLSPLVPVLDTQVLPYTHINWAVWSMPNSAMPTWLILRFFFFFHYWIPTLQLYNSVIKGIVRIKIELNQNNL